MLWKKLCILCSRRVLFLSNIFSGEILFIKVAELAFDSSKAISVVYKKI